MEGGRVVDGNLLERPVCAWMIASLIVFSTICFSLETLPDLKSTTREFLRVSELVVIVVFTAEYLYRLAIAERRLGFVFSFYGLVDLLAILPFYLAPALDMRTLRLLRLLRLARLLKLVRYQAAMLRFGSAIALAREELVIFTVMTMILVYLSAVGIYYFEHPVQPEVYRSIFDAMWWAVATLTTVGYGDIYPITIGGRVFTFAVLMLGLGLVAVPTGIISSALSEVRKSQL